MPCSFAASRTPSVSGMFWIDFRMEISPGSPDLAPGPGSRDVDEPGC